MEELSKTQMVLLVLLVTFITSVATALITATLFEQAPQPVTQTIQRVIERSVGGETIEREIVETIVTTKEEEVVVNVVESVSPAVVSVIATKDLPVIEECFVDPFGGDEFLSQFFGDLRIPQLCQKGTERRQVSSGSGFFVSSDGLIVTNRHVVYDAEASYSVVLNDGRSIDVTVLARDPLQDIAILKAEGDGFSSIPIGNSDNLRIGSTVIAIGNALGEFQNTVSLGVISGLRRTIVATDSAGVSEELRSVIQTDAAINPGNSGGPLITLDGRAIGLNTAVANDAENIGFALPANLIKRDLENINASGTIAYPFLGVRYLILNSDIQQENELAVDYGALLISNETEPAVVIGSPADKAGLKEGDIILEFGGEKISENNHLANVIQKYQVGAEVTLKVLSGEEEKELKVILGEL
ncbi:S1C family serine protease [Patescibacteria group bacterium]